ncbi:MerR-like DNA binding protein [Ulvibacter sp. MAR_2010_11]|uniref:chaperone modulator CbpM n=1 Tax=Ulvibacter sp. MAR_2010_11 TaxID=1250229 RepID=UPI000C2C4B4F|nr:chaperone modulator CbpM [Ulvibacter sp. MAR_2010_11]PKA84475.1 MerR-like DNA binding protein [Ulvibacter sp. MAR_2010_11]
MKTTEYISISDLCTNYNIEISFITGLYEIGLLEWEEKNKTQFIHVERIDDVEKMIRIHRDLDVNPQGIDVIFHLLKKVENLQDEVRGLQGRLHLYEDL